MLEKIDNLFLKVSGWCIDFAHFFGINRKKLAYIMVIGAFGFCGIDSQLTYQNELNLNYGWLILWITILLPINCLDVHFNYREDETLPSGLLYQATEYRVFLSLMFTFGVLLTVTIIINHIFFQGVFPVKTFFLLPAPYFHVYIVLNQNHKSKYRLKSLLRLLRRRISKAFRWRPAPEPQLQPQPTNFR